MTQQLGKQTTSVNEMIQQPQLVETTKVYAGIFFTYFYQKFFLSSCVPWALQPSAAAAQMKNTWLMHHAPQHAVTEEGDGAGGRSSLAG